MSKPLEDYAIIGDGETVALVAKDGSIDWLCWPRFDSEACFAALLGDESHGRFRIGPDAAGWNVQRRYRQDTLVLETEYSRGGNRARLIDFMPLRNGASSIVRIVEGVSGQVPFRLECAPVFDYGLIPPWAERESQNVVAAMVGPHMVVLRAAVPLELTGHQTTAGFTVSGGQQLGFVLTYGDSTKPPPHAPTPYRALRATERWWQGWAGQFNKPTRWREQVMRSLITLKALIHHPSGGLVAAPTTSLPEIFSGSANWDYRYCWLRDATFTVSALLNAGYHEEAEAWRGWMLRVIGGSPDKLRVMYRVDGVRHLPEWELGWLPGYESSRPVHNGNQASAQEQVDIHGEVIEALHLLAKAGLERTEHGCVVEKRLVERLEDVWCDKGHGVWENRGETQHYVYSKVMAWAGIDQFLRGPLSRTHAEPDLVDRLRSLCQRIHAEVCDKGFDRKRGHFVHYYGSSELDGSLLLIPATGFLPIDDPRITGTIQAIEREMMEGGLVLRKPRSIAPREGAFLACTCWLVDCMAMQGRQADAEALFERLLSISNDVGLLAEEYDLSRRRLCGNFPQALSHLALVTTGLGLSGPVLQRSGG